MTWMRDNLGAILNHLVEGQFGVYLLCLVAAGSTRPRNLSDGNDTGPSNNISRLRQTVLSRDELEVSLRPSSFAVPSLA